MASTARVHFTNSDSVPAYISRVLHFALLIQVKDH